MPARCPPRCCLPSLQQHVISSCQTAGDAGGNGIWITDRLLSSAFERYCRVSWAAGGSRRGASSVPGPLESRRRLGRRQMTDLNAMQLHPSVPSWAFEYPADLTKWRWEAPSSPADREARDHRGLVKGYGKGAVASNDAAVAASLPVKDVVLGSLSKWLLGTGARPGSAHKADDDTRLGPGGSAFETQTQTVDDPIRESVILLREIGALDALARPGLAAASAEAATANINAIVLKFEGLRISLQRCTSLGLLQPGEILTAVETIADALELHFQGAGPCHQMQQELYSAIVSGIMSYREGPLPQSFRGIWGKLLARVAKLPASEGLYMLVRRITAEIPRWDLERPRQLKSLGLILQKVVTSWAVKEPLDEARGVLTSAISAAVEESEVLVWQLSKVRFAVHSGIPYLANRHANAATRSLHLCRRALRLCDTVLLAARQNSTASFQTQRIATLAEALARIDSQKHGALLTAMDAFVRDQPTASSVPVDQQHRLRLDWLSTLSQMPKLSQAALLKSLSYLYGDKTEKDQVAPLLTNRELCVLIVEQWASRCYVSQAESRLVLEDLASARDSAVFGCLITSVGRALEGSPGQSSRARLLYHTIRLALDAIGRTDQLVPSLGAHHAHMPLRAREKERVASTWEAHDPGVAAAVRGLSGPVTHWERSVLEMADEHHPFDVFQVLGVPLPFRAPRRAMQERLGQQGQQQQAWRLPKPSRLPCRRALVAAVSERISRADHLNDRQAQRWVEHCVRLLRGGSRAEWSVAVMALSRVMTRDLDRGQLGRTERLRGLVKIVERGSGEGDASETRAALNRWRQANLWARRVGAPNTRAPGRRGW